MARRKIKSITCDIAYPISRFDLIDRYGDCKVEFINGDVQFVRNIISGYEVDVFDSYGHLVAVIE